MTSSKRIAVIGSGVSGLAAASVLCKVGHDVTVYEKSAHVGGHAQTLPVYFGGSEKSTSRFVSVDVGFMVFNHCTYTNMIPWFESHSVKFEPSDMSLSVSLKDAQGQEIAEWGSDLAGLLARRKNLIDPSFWLMLKDMTRFNTEALAFLKEQNGDDEDGYSAMVSDETLGAYLKRKAYAQSLADCYIIPVCAAIWSCPTEQVLDFSVYFILTFMKNHHMLQITGRPQWYTTAGKSEEEKLIRLYQRHIFLLKTLTERTQEGYVRKVAAEFWNKIRVNTAIISVTTETLNNGNTLVKVTDKSGAVEMFDHCIMACHAPETVALLGESITSTENSILSAFLYYDSKIYLHRDPKLMPSRKAAWSSWNFMGSYDKGAFVTYWLNRLQNLDEKICQGEPVLISLNPSTSPRSDLIEAEWVTGRPVPTIQAAKAQRQVVTIQGIRNLWFAGAYLRFGSHEDGVRSGFIAAHSLLESLQKQPKGLSYKPKPCIPTFQLGWIESTARLFVTQFLSQFILVGKLELREIGGQAFGFEGKKETELPISSLSIHPLSSLQAIGLTPTNPFHVVLEVIRPSFYTKVATRHDLGLADAFIDGDCRTIGNDSVALVTFLELLILNREAHFKKNHPSITVASSENKGFSSYARRLTSSLAKFLPKFLNPTPGSPITAIIGMGASYLSHLRRYNNLQNSHSNIKAHYDASNEMFSMFLDETMTYSAGIFMSSTDTLYQSQMNKLNAIISKARVRSTDHVLEIGFGWGSLSMALVRTTGCRVTGITLADEQKKLAEERVRAAGLQDKINFELCDYRVHEHPSGKGERYDRIVSCEMLEAVGHEYLGEYFAHVSRLLKNDGIVVIQVITTPDDRYEEYQHSSDFIKEQIFPGCCVPSFSAVVNAAANHSDLIVEHAENNCGISYARTLELWRQRFEANANKIMSLNPAFNEYFIRKWIYYFAYCESGFRTRTLGDFQIVFSRSGNENLELIQTRIQSCA